MSRSYSDWRSSSRSYRFRRRSLVEARALDLARLEDLEDVALFHVVVVVEQDPAAAERVTDRRARRRASLPGPGDRRANLFLGRGGHPAAAFLPARRRSRRATSGAISVSVRIARRTASTMEASSGSPSSRCQRAEGPSGRHPPAISWRAASRPARCPMASPGAVRCTSRPRRLLWRLRPSRSPQCHAPSPSRAIRRSRGPWLRRCEVAMA